jgi:hypothetical protein
MATESHPTNRTIDTSILINAPLAKVRSLLFDFASYPSWSTFVHSIEPQDVRSGTPLAVGQKLSVTFHPPDGKPMTMVMDVYHVEENGFAWEGKLAGVNWFFGGRHMFFLSDDGNGQTKLRHREEFFGVLYTPLMNWAGMEAKTRANYEAFNESVKVKAEQEESKL